MSNLPKPSAEGSGLSLAQLWHHYTRYPYLLAKIGLAAVIVVLSYIALNTVEAVLFPVLVSLLLAYVLDPAIDWFEHRGMARSSGILLFLVLGAIGLLVFVLFLYPTIAHLLVAVGEKFPPLLDLLRTDAIPWIEATFSIQVPANLSVAMTEYGETLQAQVPRVAKSVSAWVGSAWTKTGSIVASLMNVVMIPVFTFYFLRDFDLMKAKAETFIPLPQKPWILSRLRGADEVVGAYIRGQIEVATILAVLYATGLAIVFGFMGVGVTSGIAVGLLTGLLNVVPYFGFIIGILLSTAIVLIEWSGWWPLMGVALVFGVVQGLEGYVITPRIVGEKVGLSPVAVILVLLLGAEILGLLGVVLAIPLAGAFGVVLPDIIRVYKTSNFYTGVVDLDGPETEPTTKDPDATS